MVDQRTGDSKEGGGHKHREGAGTWEGRLGRTGIDGFERGKKKKKEELVWEGSRWMMSLRQQLTVYDVFAQSNNQNQWSAPVLVYLRV